VDGIATRRHRHVTILFIEKCCMNILSELYYNFDSFVESESE